MGLAQADKRSMGVAWQRCRGAIGRGQVRPRELGRELNPNPQLHEPTRGAGATQQPRN